MALRGVDGARLVLLSEEDQRARTNVQDQVNDLSHGLTSWVGAEGLFTKVGERPP